MARSLLEFLLKTMKQGTGVKDTERDLKDLDKQVTKSSKGMSIMDGITLRAGAKIHDLGMQALRSIPQLVDQGVEAQRARKGLEGYAGGAEQAEAMITALQDATGGGISKMAAMENASRLLAMKLATTADEAAELTDIAVTLGASMGKGPQQSFEEFTLLLANQSILRLDTFGISASKVRERMNELAEQGIAPADRNARFMTATMEEAAIAMDKLEASGFEATSSLDRLKAMAADTTMEFALFLAEGLMPWIDGILMLKDVMIDQNEQLVINTDSYEEYRDIVDTMPRYFDALWEHEYAAMKQNMALNDSIERSKGVIDGWMGVLVGVPGPLDEIGDELEELGDEAEEAEPKVISLLDGLDRKVASPIASFIEDLEWMIAGGGEINAAFDAVKESVDKGIITPELGKKLSEILLGVAVDFTNEIGQMDIDTAAQKLSEGLGIPIEEAKELITGTDSVQSALDGLSGVEVTKVLADSLQIPISEAIDMVGPGGLQGALTALANTEFVINIRYKYKNWPPPHRRGGGTDDDIDNLPEGAQYGAQWVVEGNSGVDRVPVFFMASRGETVTVTPEYEVPPPTSTHHYYNYSPTFSNATPNVIDDFMLLQALAGV